MARIGTETCTFHSLNKNNLITMITKKGNCKKGKLKITMRNRRQIKGKEKKKKKKRKKSYHSPDHTSHVS